MSRSLKRADLRAQIGPEEWMNWRRASHLAGCVRELSTVRAALSPQLHELRLVLRGVKRIHKRSCRLLCPETISRRANAEQKKKGPEEIAVQGPSPLSAQSEPGACSQDQSCSTLCEVLNNWRPKSSVLISRSTCRSVKKDEEERNADERVLRETAARPAVFANGRERPFVRVRPASAEICERPLAAVNPQC